ncbi:GntR family transcriptional regulator [Alloiococcus sp. CFN-8]|uniref:GntR family transcriptional regulator n=1 Tax=Alloiococcus sp. CFN-8 TaxID=3416081 RepID=UPI003CF505B5
MIDKNSPIPIYYQLKQDFLDNISSGRWQSGHPINSERELSEYYGVSRMTIRQALGELVQEGILYKEKGKGTFVSEKKLRQKDIMSFSEIISKAGFTLETKVLEFSAVDTPDKLKEIFSYEKLYKIDRLRMVDGEAVAKELVYLPVSYLANIQEEELKGSLFFLLEERGHSIAYSESSIQAVMIDDGLKELFKVDMEVPLLKTVNIVMEKESHVLFYEESIYRSDKYLLQVNIMRKEGRMR